MNACTVQRLAAGQEEAVACFLRAQPSALLYHSLKYRDLLRRVVGGEDVYLVARCGNAIVGLLPTWVATHPQHGAIVNSLPFFGSHGGVVCAADGADPFAVRAALLGAFASLARDVGARLTTLIANPFDEHAARYDVELTCQYRDERIGQMTPLAGLAGEADLDAALLARFDSVRRRNIRKARKVGVQVRRSAAAADFDFLRQTHEANMAAEGGRTKPPSFFAAVPAIFDSESDYGLYIAERDGERIAALLVFFYNRVAEYFVPATVSAHRKAQPASCLICEAMKDAVRLDCAWWNWGGTWLNQEGVHAFKKRWGTTERRYRYYVQTFTDVSDILALGPEGILAAYPHYYVVPFSVLDT